MRLLAHAVLCKLTIDSQDVRPQMYALESERADDLKSRCFARIVLSVKFGSAIWVSTRMQVNTSAKPPGPAGRPSKIGHNPRM